MREITVAGLTVPAWIIIPVVLFVWVTVLLILKKTLFSTIKKFASRTKTEVDDVFIAAAELPLNILIFASAGVIIDSLIPLANAQGEASKLTAYILLGFKAATIFAIIIFVDRVVSGLMKVYANRIEILQNSGGIARGVLRVVVIGLGLLILLDSFGVSITPIIASLGIGSLAVALALQPTLENLFAGVQLIADKPIKVGQYIKLESGEEGYVYKIGWRSTWVRMGHNNIVVMPNSNLVNSKIINYYYPDKELAVLVEVGVHYGSDLEHVERITVEVAKEILRDVPGGVKDFQPVIRFHTFADFSINFTVVLRAKEVADSAVIKHEFIKRLHKRYARENIIIPYPIEAVNYDQERAFSKDDGNQNLRMGG